MVETQGSQEKAARQSLTPEPLSRWAPPLLWRLVQMVPLGEENDTVVFEDKHDRLIPTCRPRSEHRSSSK